MDRPRPLSAAARRAALACLLWLASPMAALADSSSVLLASYYERHMAVIGGVAHGWVDRGQPQAMLSDVIQVGVSRDAYFALKASGESLTWGEHVGDARTLMQGVARFAAGASGWAAGPPA